MRGMKNSKHPCVISSDALWMLTAAGGAILLLPLEPFERTRVEDACAQAHKSLLAAAGNQSYRLPSDWINEHEKEETHDV